MATHVCVALPDEGAATHTLYLLHGLTGTHTDWLYQGEAYRLANKYNIAIVMPDGNRSFYTDAAHGLKWETWVASELPQRLGGLVNLPKGRELTAIGGLSMGGYGAMRLALHFPENYCAAMSLSGTLDVTEKPFVGRHPDLYADIFGLEDAAGTDHDLLYQLEGLQKRCGERGVEIPRLWATCGTGDRLLPHHEAFVATAAEHGIELESYTAPGVHNWDFWNEHIIHALNWWLDR